MYKAHVLTPSMSTQVCLSTCICIEEEEKDWKIGGVGGEGLLLHWLGGGGTGGGGGMEKELIVWVCTTQTGKRGEEMVRLRRSTNTYLPPPVKKFAPSMKTVGPNGYLQNFGGHRTSFQKELWRWGKGEGGGGQEKGGERERRCRYKQREGMGLPEYQAMPSLHDGWLSTFTK
jgi:hypothetical protein